MEGGGYFIAYIVWKRWHLVTIKSRAIFNFTWVFKKLFLKFSRDNGPSYCLNPGQTTLPQHLTLDLLLLPVIIVGVF